MNPGTQEAILKIAAASHAGNISFGQAVQTLTSQGVESYRADYRLRQTSYFTRDQAATVPLSVPSIAIPIVFDPAALKAAILGSQRGEVRYPEFLERSMRAGCVGYTVWITGRHVIYLGRAGETHVEHFPS